MGNRQHEKQVTYRRSLQRKNNKIKKIQELLRTVQRSDYKYSLQLSFKTQVMVRACTPKCWRFGTQAWLAN